MYQLAALVLVACMVSSADTSILFSTDFSTLPDGWVNDEWEFNHPGAHVGNGVQWDDWSAEFSSLTSSPGIYFVPDGTDSVVIHIEHCVTLDGDFYSSRVQLWTNHSGWGEDIFNKSGSGGVIWITDPVHFVLSDPDPGTWIGFKFRAYLSAGYMGYSGLEWTIDSMTVTAYGDALGLETTTWSAIKSISDTL